MDGPQGGSNSPPPFLTKTYDMVDDPSSNSVVSWSHNNKSFIVWNPPEFSRDLLPKYFKHNNFSSFVRQLNTYGFRKIDPDQWEFANDEFIRGQRHLLNNIHRRKPIHSHSLNLQGQGNSSGPLVDAERQELDEKIKRLKRDKGALIAELQKHTHQQHGMEQQMQSLEDRLQVMEQRQRSMMDFLAQLVQRPGFFSNLVEQSDPHTRKRRFPKTGFVYEDADTEENRVVSFQPLCRENSDMSPMHTLDLEPFEKMESSLNSLENFFHYVSQASGDDMYCDDPTVHCLPSAVVITEMHASSGETDVNLQSPSPKLHPSSTCFEEVHSSPEMGKSTNYAESPALPFLEIQADTRSKVSEIDVNAEPSVCEVSSPRERATGTPTPSAPAGVNDMFWEQFLTETPGSSEPQEVQSERRDANEKRSDQKKGEKGNNWWDMRNRRNVDHLTEKMGHLTSAEKT